MHANRLTSDRLPLIEIDPPFHWRCAILGVVDIAVIPHGAFELRAGIVERVFNGLKPDRHVNRVDQGAWIAMVERAAQFFDRWRELLL
jgi:hypothetical protein